jgi:hypothetical protein
MSTALRTRTERTRTMQTIDLSAPVRPTVGHTELVHLADASARWHAESGHVASFPAPVCPIGFAITYGTGTNGFKRHDQRPEETFL